MRFAWIFFKLSKSTANSQIFNLLCGRFAWGLPQMHEFLIYYVGAWLGFATDAQILLFVG